MEDGGKTASSFNGKVFYFKNIRISINKKITDIAYDGRGVTLFHPFTKNFSFKQYKLIYTWLLKGKFK